jgi:tetratricopeptide (TPR) repeat protein
VAAIVDEAGGNALYLEELVRAAASAEAGEQALEPSPLSAGGRRLRPPKTVTAMVQSRIEVLAPAERRALRAGSVLGGSFWLEAVDRLLGGAEGLVRLDATLRRLVDMEVLVRCERSHLEGKRQYAFRHGLLRDAAYAMLTEEDRALGHRLAAAFLEEAGEPEAAVIAEHHLRGGERAAAAIWYRRAAEQALDANDLAGAIERAERAASCGAEGEELGAVRLRQAEACSYLGDAARTRARALEAIALLPEGSGPWGMAVAHAATAAQRLGHNDQAVEMAERLLERAAQPSPPRALLIAAARVAGNICNAGRPDLCERMLRAIRAARGAGEGAMGGFGSPAARDAGQGAMGGFGSPAARDAGQGAMGGFGSPQNQALRGDPLLTARVLTAEGQLRLAAGPLDRAIEVSREAAAIFERVGDHRAACSVRVNVGFSLMTLGAYDEAAAVLEATLAEADRMHLLSAAAAVRHNLGLVRALAGDADEGLRLERAAAEAYAARGDRRMESAARAYVALILELRGDLPGALAEASAAVKAAEPGSEEHALALAVQARLFVRDGDAAQALAAAREAAALREGRAPMHEGEVTVRLALAEARHLSGDLEGARAAIAEARDMVSAQARALESDSRRATFLARVPENARVLSLAREWLSEEG